MARPHPRLLFALVLASAAASLPSEQAFVRTIQLHVPEGRDFFGAYERVRGAEGLPLDEALIAHHVEALGELGWVAKVDVDLAATPDPVHFDVIYRLIPRGHVDEVRFEGNEVLDQAALARAVTSRPGQHYNLRQALDDAHQINLQYQDAGYSFSGILDSENVHFQDGVLTFKVRESRLAADDRAKLEAALGTSLAGPLDRRRLSAALAEGDLRDALRLDSLEVQLDRRSGELHFGQSDAPATTTASGRAPLRAPDAPAIRVRERMSFSPPRPDRTGE